MNIPWGQYLDLARCLSLTRELDLGSTTISMAAGLHLLQRDLIVDSWTRKEQLLERQKIFSRAKGFQGYDWVL